MMTLPHRDQAEFAAALLDPERACPPGLRAWNGSDPSARLAVYRNNVVSSLIDALADTFPVVQQLVGEEFFRAMASVFVRRAPPASVILAHYGAAFPAFIEGFEPAQSLPYLADVARLEFYRVCSYHAADAEPVAEQSVALALSSGERMGELELVCHPSVQTITSNYSVVSLWAAHQHEGEVGRVDVDVPEQAIVLRAGLDVLVVPASAGAVQFTQALQQGHKLGEAAAQAAMADSQFDLTDALTVLLSHQALTSIHLPTRH